MSGRRSGDEGAQRTAVAGQAEEGRGEGDRPRTVGILTPTGSDGPLAHRVLGRWGLQASVCGDVASLCEAIERGLGVAVIAEEALRPSAIEALVATLDRQPSWSDVPLIILTSDAKVTRGYMVGVEGLAVRGNVSLLERPARVATLVTAVRAALRARMRQYEVRDYLRELRTAREVAEAANLAKSEFLAVMSHELRTPLNAIGGYAELIELGIRGPVTPEQRADLERIQKSQRHLLGLINGVLNYARVETGNVPYELSDVPLAELLAMCEALVTPQVRAKGLRLTLPSRLPPVSVRADREKAQQILINLLTNAIKFTGSGGKIGVAYEVTDGTVRIRVADTGRGIAREKLAVIFDPFVQIDAGLTRAHEGVGLGLAISRDLARGMHGDLSVESALGAGSTFTLTLPVARHSPEGTNGVEDGAGTSPAP